MAINEPTVENARLKQDAYLRSTRHLAGTRLRNINPLKRECPGCVCVSTGHQNLKMIAFDIPPYFIPFSTRVMTASNSAAST